MILAWASPFNYILGNDINTLAYMYNQRMGWRL